MNFENYELLKIIILPAKITTPMDDQTRERKKHFRTAMKDPRVYTPIKALPMPHRTTRELKHRHARLQQDIPPSPPFKPATPQPPPTTYVCKYAHHFGTFRISSLFPSTT